MVLSWLVACGTLGLSLGGGGEARVQFDEGTLDFGRVVEGARPALGTAVLLNVGDVPVELVAADIETATPGVFSFSSTLPLPLELPVDETFPVVLRFGPLDEVPYEGELAVSVGDGTTLTLPLAGEGCPAGGADNRCAR